MYFSLVLVYTPIVSTCLPLAPFGSSSDIRTRLYTHPHKPSPSQQTRPGLYAFLPQKFLAYYCQKSASPTPSFANAYPALSVYLAPALFPVASPLGRSATNYVNTAYLRLRLATLQGAGYLCSTQLRAALTLAQANLRLANDKVTDARCLLARLVAEHDALTGGRTHSAMPDSLPDLLPPEFDPFF
ncbi:hypothetical protein CVT25_012636 [Psilocybe cyanescens]|uniref:Uncharacterized protein n=1 Tax=Psilocybe cyanescens TaxID=93625 RepID=A0A409XFU8_PSICY|nr:hypothetical protein CVT25_012636 [Psilocybe cyanescens]